ncbi:MAG: spore coat protein CotJB [Puniceicoccales bacterium]|jgi:spore coat protein JB|nr:spore coat protein CotJB [Puniceicoccales bacterium]
MNEERTMLLRRIQICDFAMNDAALFLDVNPNDQMALGYFKKYNDMRKQAADEYISKYGPLAHADYDGGERWKWVDSPWPWQNEEA